MISYRPVKYMLSSMGKTLFNLPNVNVVNFPHGVAHMMTSYDFLNMLEVI